jgi:nucleoside-diphosphate-sugar epimerase
VWIIVGAGYVGTALVRRLVSEGREVVATRRAAFDAPAGSRAAIVDLGHPETLRELPLGNAVVVCCAPPGAAPAHELATLAPARRLVYVSSTAVYPPAAGAWVDETWPIAPHTTAGQARAGAESALTANAVALRAAGIWGPDRGIEARLRAGTYRIVGDGLAHVSRIHVDDLVDAIVRAGSCDVRGAINIADDDPAPIGEVADAIASRLGVGPPPRVPLESVEPEIAGMLGADRRIANGRMKRELGVVLRYPSAR